MDDWDDLDDVSDDLEEWDDENDDEEDHDLAAAVWDDDDGDGDEFDDGGAGGGLWRAGARQGSSGGGVVSAWQFGTATAVAGWLLDQQADRIAEAVREAVVRAPGGDLSAVPHGSGTAGRPDRGHAAPVARRWSALSAPPIDWDAAPLRPGDVLERSRLAVTLALHLGAGRALGLDARPLAASGSPPWLPDIDWRQLSFAIAAVDLVPELPLWVMADIRPRGFDAERLKVILADPGPPGRAYCFLDTPEDAVKVIEWGLARHGLFLRQFRWQPAA